MKINKQINSKKFYNTIDNCIKTDLKFTKDKKSKMHLSLTFCLMTQSFLMKKSCWYVFYIFGLVLSINQSTNHQFSFFSFSFMRSLIVKLGWHLTRGVFRGGLPLNQWNLLISGGFQAPTVAEPPLEREKNLSPPLDKFLNTPLYLTFR